MDWLMSELNKTMGDIQRGMNNIDRNYTSTAKQDMNKAMGRLETLLSFLKDNN